MLHNVPDDEYSMLYPGQKVLIQTPPGYFILHKHLEGRIFTVKHQQGTTARATVHFVELEKQSLAWLFRFRCQPLTTQKITIRRKEKKQ